MSGFSSQGWHPLPLDLGDVMGSFINLITDTIVSLPAHLLIMGGIIAVIFGIFMRTMGHLVTMTVGAMVVFVIGQLIYRIAAEEAVPMQALQNMWGQAAQISLQQVVAYFLTFGVVILAVGLIRTLLFNRD